MASVPWCKYFPFSARLQLFITGATVEFDSTVAVRELQTIPAAASV